MRRSTLYIFIGIGAGVVILLLYAGLSGAWYQPQTPAAAVFFDSGGASTTPTDITPNPVSPAPQNSKLYRSSTYGFSLYYPDHLAAIEHPQAANSMVVLFQDKARE